MKPDRFFVCCYAAQVLAPLLFKSLSGYPDTSTFLVDVPLRSFDGMETIATKTELGKAVEIALVEEWVYVFDDSTHLTPLKVAQRFIDTRSSCSIRFTKKALEDFAYLLYMYDGPKK